MSLEEGITNETFRETFLFTAPLAAVCPIDSFEPGQAKDDVPR